MAVERNDVTLTGTSETVVLGTGVDPARSFNKASARTDGSSGSWRGSRALVAPTFAAGGDEVLLTRGDNGVADAHVELQTVTDPRFSVQHVTITLGADVAANTGAITAVDEDKAIVIPHCRTGGDARSEHLTFARVRLNTATQIEALVTTGGSTDIVVEVQIIEWDGGAVEHGEVSLPADNTSVDVTGLPNVPTGEATVFYSYTAPNESNRPARTFCTGEILNGTSLRFTGGGGGGTGQITVSWFRLHADTIKVQRTTDDDAGATVSGTLGEAVTVADTITVSPQQGNVRCTDDSTNSLHHGYSTQKLTSTTGTTTIRGATNGTLTAHLEAVELLDMALEPATISRLPVDLAMDTGRNTDIVAVAQIDNYDASAGQHDAYGHTSDLGANPADWETTATLIQANQNPASNILWSSRSPDTSYWIALVSVEGASKELSNRVQIVTAPARPTSVSASEVTDNSFKVSGTDATAGNDPHRYTQRKTSEGKSDRIVVGETAAAVAPEHLHDDLEPGTEYEAGAFAFDDGPPFRASGLVTVTQATTPPPVAITTESLPDAVLGAAYSETLEASGGAEPYSWSVDPDGGELPPGLTLGAASGEISGTPTETGTWEFTAQVADDGDVTDTQELSITVTAPDDDPVQGPVHHMAVIIQTGLREPEEMPAL